MSQNVLTFVCNEYLPYIVVENNRITGPRGDLEFGLYGSHLFGLNISYVKPSDEDAFKVNLGNGSYGGIIGMLQRQEVDAYYFLKSRTFFDDFLDLIPSGEAYFLNILQSPQVKAHSISILETFNVFSLKIWILFALSILLLTIAFILSNTNKSIGLHSFHVIRCHFGQPDISPNLWSKSVKLTITLLFGSILFLVILLNLVHTDLVSIDSSNVTRAIDDVVRLKHFTPCMIKDSSTLYFMKNSKDKVYKEILKRVIKEGTVFKMDMDSISKWTPQHLWLARETMLNLLWRSLCRLRSENLKFWMSEESFAEVPLTQYVRKGLELNKRQLLEIRGRQLSEHGLYKGVELRGDGKSNSPKSDKCKVNHIYELLTESYEDMGFELDKFKSVFHSFFAALLLCWAALLIEITFN